jgi:hypothetical protein
MRVFFACVIFSTCLNAYGQVDEIKAEARENNSRGSRFKLSADRSRYPSLVSVEVLAQGAINPMAIFLVWPLVNAGFPTEGFVPYHCLWPRVKGHWGLFSTDYRMNYLLEETADGSLKHLRTSDWQIVQLNIITSRFITLRLGNGFMKEAFAGGNTYYEWSGLLGFHNTRQSRLLWFEYRHAHDFNTGAWPRLELHYQYQHQIIEKGALHGHVTVGIVYQDYYRSVPVLGFQGGLALRFY